MGTNYRCEITVTEKVYAGDRDIVDTLYTVSGKTDGMSLTEQSHAIGEAVRQLLRLYPNAQQAIYKACTDAAKAASVHESDTGRNDG